MENSIEEDIKIAVDKFSDNKDIDSAMLIVEKFILGNYILLGGNRGNIVKDSLRYILSDYKRVLKENEIIKGNYDTLSKDIQQVTKELGLPEDTIIADEMVQMIKQKFIPKSKVKDKIEELKLIVEKYDRQRENDEDTVLCYEEVSIYWSKIKAYEELLEKEE